MSGLPPKSPRQKKQKSVKPSTVVYRDLKERSRLSKSISKPIRVAIADAIIAFSEMEATADIVIWKLTGLSDVDGKLLTQIDAKQKLELAKKLSERYGIPPHPHPQATAEIWSNVRTLCEARNKIAHGIWRMIDEKEPIAISHRMKGDAGHDMSEHFPLTRLQDIQQACNSINVRFEAMIQRIDALPSRPQPLPPTPTTNHPEYPLPPKKSRQRQPGSSPKSARKRG